MSPPYFSASIPFVGSSVFLTTEGEPFVAVYEVVADVLQPQLVVDTDSAKTTSSGTSENVKIKCNSQESHAHTHPFFFNGLKLELVIINSGKLASIPATPDLVKVFNTFC